MVEWNTCVEHGGFTAAECPACKFEHSRRRPVVSVSTINSIVYDLAHDLDLTEKAWLIPALKSHVWHLAQQTLHRPVALEVERLVDQWIDVHERAARRR